MRVVLHVCGEAIVMTALNLQIGNTSLFHLWLQSSSLLAHGYVQGQAGQPEPHCEGYYESNGSIVGLSSVAACCS